MTVRLAVTGATGRMGREVRARAADREDVEVVVAASRDPDGDLDPAADMPSLLADREPHALIDFTAPESSVEYVAAAAEAGVAAVVGTTGFDEAGEASLDVAAEDVPILHAPNFSRGVTVLGDLVERAVAALPDYDVELTETHHAGKRDAPSGTASDLLARVESARSGTRGASRVVNGRVGDAPREPGEVGVHARRAGVVRGEHEVLLAGDDEVLELSHRAGSRGVFAAGALDAAVWLADRDAGRFEFADVLGGDR